MLPTVLQCNINNREVVGLQRAICQTEASILLLQDLSSAQVAVARKEGLAKGK